MQTYSVLMFRLQVTLAVLDRTREQWNTFFRLQWGWLGNVLMGEDRHQVQSYITLPRFGLGIMLSSISGVQQIRSQSLQKIKKELAVLPTELEDTRLAAKRLIESANLRTDDWSSLLAECIRLINIDKRGRRATVFDIPLPAASLQKHGLQRSEHGYAFFGPLDR